MWKRQNGDFDKSPNPSGTTLWTQQKQNILAWHHFLTNFEKVKTLKFWKKIEMEASNSTFEVILSNPGLQHIGENILKHLDIQSVAKCREVSSSFLDLIDGQKFWYIEQIKIMNIAKGKQTNRSTGTSLIKEFTSIFKFEKILLDAFDDRKTLTELKIVAKFMTKYLAENDFTNSPFYQAFKEGQIDFIKLFINSPLIDFTKTDGQGFTVFHHACSQGSKEVVEVTKETQGTALELGKWLEHGN